ncbi:MAG: hypothetical protein M5U34_37940 [Chloroflexi bacterium]|nr:hypothetical protein [Chloroflexota bacterium]
MDVAQLLNLSFIGHITDQALNEVGRADKVILGARAISLSTVLQNEYLEILLRSSDHHIGRLAILVADHTKFGSVSTVFFLAPSGGINYDFQTDSQTDMKLFSRYNKVGLRSGSGINV